MLEVTVVGYNVEASAGSGWDAGTTGGSGRQEC